MVTLGGGSPGGDFREPPTPSRVSVFGAGGAGEAFMRMYLGYGEIFPEESPRWRKNRPKVTVGF